jgi:hypothetical protein
LDGDDQILLTVVIQVSVGHASAQILVGHVAVDLGPVDREPVPLLSIGAGYPPFLPQMNPAVAELTTARERGSAGSRKPWASAPSSARS